MMLLRGIFVCLTTDNRAPPSKLVRFVTAALAGLTDDVPYNSPIPLF